MVDFDITAFKDYVYKYPEALGSDVGANIAELIINRTPEQSAMSLNTLVKCASYSITAYRAVEWLCKNGVVSNGYLTGISKPTTYAKMAFQVVDVTE